MQYLLSGLPGTVPLPQEPDHVLLGEAAVAAGPDSVGFQQALVGPAPDGVDVDVEEARQFRAGQHAGAVQIHDHVTLPHYCRHILPDHYFKPLYTGLESPIGTARAQQKVPARSGTKVPGKVR